MEPGRSGSRPGKRSLASERMTSRKGNERRLFPWRCLRDDRTGKVRQECGDEHVEVASGKPVEEFAGRTFNQAQANVGTGSDECGKAVAQRSGCKADEKSESQRAAAALGRRRGAAHLPVGDIENLPRSRQDCLRDRTERQRRPTTALEEIRTEEHTSELTS